MGVVLGCGKLIVCVSHSRWLKYSPTQVHKAQEHKRQVTSYELLFLGIYALFSTCVLLMAHNCFWCLAGASGFEVASGVESA